MLLAAAAQIYKGSSKDTTWNKVGIVSSCHHPAVEPRSHVCRVSAPTQDLLWKMYVEKEAMKTGVHLPKNAADGASTSARGP